MSGCEYRRAVTKRHRLSFSPEFKSGVRGGDRGFVPAAGYTVASVCKDYELAESAVRRWVRPADIDAGLQPGVTTGEAEEIARLRKQLREVTEGRDVLARVVGFMQSRGLCSADGGGGRDGGRGLAG
jgi:transposase